MGLSYGFRPSRIMPYESIYSIIAYPEESFDSTNYKINW
jgi:hypothetical protein